MTVFQLIKFFKIHKMDLKDDKPPPYESLNTPLVNPHNGKKLYNKTLLIQKHFNILKIHRVPSSSCSSSSQPSFWLWYNGQQLPASSRLSKPRQQPIQSVPQPTARLPTPAQPFRAANGGQSRSTSANHSGCWRVPRLQVSKYFIFS